MYVVKCVCTNVYVLEGGIRNEGGGMWNEEGVDDIDYDSDGASQPQQPTHTHNAPQAAVDSAVHTSDTNDTSDTSDTNGCLGVEQYPEQFTAMAAYTHSLVRFPDTHASATSTSDHDTLPFMPANGTLFSQKHVRHGILPRMLKEILETRYLTVCVLICVCVLMCVCTYVCVLHLD